MQRIVSVAGVLAGMALGFSGPLHAERERFETPDNGRNFGVWRITNDPTVRDWANYHNTQCWSPDGTSIATMCSIQAGLRDAATGEIVTFLGEVSRRPLGSGQMRSFMELMDAVKNLENIGDIDELGGRNLPRDGNDLAVRHGFGNLEPNHPPTSVTLHPPSTARTCPVTVSASVDSR